MRGIRSFTVIWVLLLTAVAACDGSIERSGKPATGPAFSHNISADQSGYYRPLTPVRSGDWTLSHLFMGQAADFTAWEQAERTAGLAPVMLEFETATGARTRVLPSRYTVTGTLVRFAGRTADLGEVAFEGRLDADALATARRNLGDEGAVVSGTLKVGGRSISGVRLRWWAGD
ncbi:hypothetical protein [uncultured Brevundimonas sp.]|uniref:hypothetical protein n=1 Tax=uncultured Brevundimonas sp. TaxID=213418 RepID=UPI0030ECC3B6|tara:strand:- start:1028 stop:1549 length:522 start_codon:yes stop_codon:yes gene_type:complete